MEQPLVSIVMGVYNCSETLQSAIDCIRKQSFQNWEFIICDDASTDDTYSVVKSNAEKDERIVALQNESNLTLAPTLNRCIKIARGKYIARMDGDDICDYSRLEKEVQFLESHPEYAVVSCWMELFDDMGVYGLIKHDELPTGKDLIVRSQFVHAACVMRKEALESIGLYDVRPERKRVEDYDLWIRFYKAGYKGYNIQEVLYSMRDDRAAKKRRNFGNRLNETRVKFDAIRNFKGSPRMYLHLALPIIKWMVPNSIYRLKHARK